MATESFCAAFKFGIFAITVYCILIAAGGEESDADFLRCEDLMKAWVDSGGGNDGMKEHEMTLLKDLLFFLHVPRTGGRTYFHCFLRNLYTSDDECPRSYDRLRFDPSQPKCKLVVTHDDYSLISKLPNDRTSVVTVLRSPVDRIFSTYEFSVEVAARFLVHPNLTSAIGMSKRIRPKSRVVSTLDIWPWKYLVPWMREDLFARRASRRAETLMRDVMSDAYDMADKVMPLKEFIDDPIAHEIIHNGATFQVAGLTNNSYWDASHEVRRCVRKYPTLGRVVLDVAKERLNQMLYVGLTEEHEQSARMFANMVGAQVLSKSKLLESHFAPEETNTSTVSQSSLLDVEDALNPDQNGTYAQVSEEPAPVNVAESENMTVEKLMESYNKCIHSLQKSHSNRRRISLKRISPVKFSKEARQLVPDAVIKRIISLNSLDMELYGHARSIFVRQQNLMQQSQHFVAEDLDGRNTWDKYPPVSLTSLFLLCLIAVAVFVMRFGSRKRTEKYKL